MTRICLLHTTNLSFIVPPVPHTKNPLFLPTLTIFCKAPTGNFVTPQFPHKIVFVCHFPPRLLSRNTGRGSGCVQVLAIQLQVVLRGYVPHHFPRSAHLSGGSCTTELETGLYSQFLTSVNMYRNHTSGPNPPQYCRTKKAICFST